MRKVLLASWFALVACSGESEPQPEPGPVEPIWPPIAFETRKLTPGDRFAVEIASEQAEVRSSDSGANTQGHALRMVYEDEVLADGTIRRSWPESTSDETTAICTVDGRYDPKADFFAQFDALVPRTPARVGDKWSADAPLGPFLLGANEIVVGAAMTNAECRLARVSRRKDVLLQAVIEASITVMNTDKTVRKLEAKLEFDAVAAFVTRVQLREGEGGRLVATRRLLPAKD